jgi:hypothetical protein
MIPTRDIALAHLPALAARPSLLRTTVRYDAARPRAGRFSATPGDPTLDDANLSIAAAARDALFPLAEATDLHDASTAALIARLHARRGGA